MADFPSDGTLNILHSFYDENNTDKFYDFGADYDSTGVLNTDKFLKASDERLFTTLVPKGTQISTTGTDLNTITYLKVGKYFCSQTATAKTLLNCPTNVAFMMEVYSPLATTIDNETTGTWVYRLRKLIEYSTGITYYQMCNTSGTANVWTYGSWYQVPENLISIDDTASPPIRTYQKGNSNTPIYLDNNGRFQACSRSFTELNNYLPLAGGNMTGNITFNTNGIGQINEPKLIWKTIGQNTPYIGFAEDQTDGTFVICSMEQNAEVETNGSRNYRNGLAIGGGSGNLFWKGNKIAVTSDIPTSLKNPNSLTIQSNGTTIGSYDGSSAKTINIPASTVTLNGTATDSASFYAPTTVGTSGYYLKSNGSGAPTWAAIPTDTNTTNVIAGNGLTGGGSANSSSGVTLNVGAGTGISVAADTVSLATYGTASTYGPSANATLSHSGTFTVPKITTDAYGRVTASNITYTLPASGNTDTKVTQAAAITTSGNYPVILGYSTATTAVTNTVNKCAAITANPSTGALTATKVYGAVWNDYAEYRNQEKEIKPGYCVYSSDDGKVHLTNEKFQACDGIVSDTFGFGIGETDNCKTPLAVAGRALAYAENPEELHSGDTVCAGPNGKVVKMTREEICEWPDRIVGVVSEIPTYETWGTGNVKVNGRIWVKVK